ncbi:alpha/beta hydrolase [Microbulbifer sp. SSSA002]|uniref:alpha/beta hydrolase n=1 Tax=Microbulbifer sp. SSSA002 TaxID=3243376 RepID=UPI0040397CCF
MDTKAMARYFSFFAALLMSTFVYAIDIEKSPLIVGDSISFASKILDEQRTLNIYLPDSYHRETGKSYPVIYLLDGSLSEDFIHIAGILQFGAFSWINMIPESILVGVANVDRKRDFTFPSTQTLDQQEFPSSGGSKKFIEFLDREAQPLIKKNYRTEDSTTLIGQSLGGLVATEILWKRPNLFDNYIIISPSLWWSGESLLTDIPKNCCDNKLIYIGVGKEGKTMERLARALFNKLNNEKSKAKVHFGYFEQLDHGDTLHLAVYDAFEKLFANKASQ